MESIAKLLPKTRQKADIISQVRSALVVRAAQDVLRNEIGDGTVVRSFRDGVLSVACGRAEQVRDIVLRQTELVARLNDRLGCDAVARVRTVG